MGVLEVQGISKKFGAIQALDRVDLNLDRGEALGLMGDNGAGKSTLIKITMALKPNGGTICIQSGGAAAANHNERMQGIRDTISGASGTEPRGNRLTGDNGWAEVDGCPLYTGLDVCTADNVDSCIEG